MGFYSSMGLIFVPWPRRSFLVGEIFFNSRILRDPFLIGLSWLELSVGHKIFPCQPRQWFAYPLQLHSVNFLSHLYILVISFKCLLTSRCSVSFEVEQSTLSYHCWVMNVQARLTSLLGPSPLPNMDKFINTTNLPLSKMIYRNKYKCNFWLTGTPAGQKPLGI